MRRTVASALGLLVILFNLVAGPLLASTASAGAAPFAEEIFGDRIVVCTGAGMVVFDRDGRRVPADGRAPAMCVFCLPLVQGGVDAPVVAALPDGAGAVEPGRWDVAAVPVPAPTPVIRAAAPRGPPRT